MDHSSGITQVAALIQCIAKGATRNVLHKLEGKIPSLGFAELQETGGPSAAGFDEVLVAEIAGQNKIAPIEVKLLLAIRAIGK